jgi:hypothetical protein
VSVLNGQHASRLEPALSGSAGFRHADAFHRLLGEDAVSGRLALRRGQHAPAFVEANGVDTHACLLGQLSDLHGVPFFAYEVSVAGEEVLWDVAVIDDDMARAILEEFYALPDSLAETFDDLRERFAQHGMEIISGGSAHHLETRYKV